MLIYIVFLCAVSIFLYQESRKFVSGNSSFLKEACADPLVKKTILCLLRRLCLLSAASAFFMLICFVYYQLTGTLLRPLAAASILLYTVGLIVGMLKLKKIYPF